MKQYFDTLNVILVDFKLEFGKTADGKIVLADEISPDTCRLWDKTTKEKLDKDRFRRDMGGVEEAYQGDHEARYGQVSPSARQDSDKKRLKNEISYFKKKQHSV